MKIKKLQKILEKILKSKGNIDVVIYSDMSGKHFNKVIKCKNVKAKKHYEGFFLSSALATGGFGGRKAFQEPTQSKLENKKDETVLLIS